MAAAAATPAGRSGPRRQVWTRLAAAALAPVDAASLALFRIGFGAVMAWEVVRYFRNGWIGAYYVAPELHFKYFGFEWVRAWPGAGMYVHFAVLGLAALGVMLGAWYRLSAAVFFVGFAYVFLLDQARYLNHFYLIVLVSLLLAFLPLHAVASVDAFRGRVARSGSAPAWALWLLRAQVGIPYFYGGLAKLNGDWLRGEPMRTWLADRTHVPFLGPYFDQEWTALAFTYGGILLDLLIVPSLLWRRTRAWAFALGLCFHGLNAALFRIGIFPWLMMAATTIFFAPDWPRRAGVLPARGPLRADDAQAPSAPRGWGTLAAVSAYVALQVVMPLRHHLYPGDVNWTEEGHRFSWHMKLRDKEAEARFVLLDPATGESRVVDPADVLARHQVEKMASRPDMVLQFAHDLARRHRDATGGRAEVRAWVTATLNDRAPQALVDPTVDLAAQPRSLGRASWILPLQEMIRTAPTRR